VIQGQVMLALPLMSYALKGLLMRRTLLTLCSVCLGLTASSTLASLDCNLAKYEYTVLVALEGEAERWGGWSCGYPRERALHNIQMRCEQAR